MSSESIVKMYNKDGSAYGRAKAQRDVALTDVSAGTPTGEYLRRYWHPVAVSADLDSRPQRVRVLGEDLVLFRDKQGRAGLLYERCMHRGSSLFFGKVEDEGLRCCYHGWLFDVTGNCREQPCEPNCGTNLEHARQPWYPVEEQYGLVFAYMGPPDKKPVLPRYDILENLQPGEFIEVDGTGYGGYAAPVAEPKIPYHWLQNWENIVDPFHVQVLHSTFSGAQFADGFRLMPKVEFEYAGGGVIYHAFRDFDDGRSMDRINSALLPNISVIPAVDLAAGRGNMIGWHVAVDDTTMRVFFAARRTQPGRFAGYPMHNGKLWTALTEQEKQDFPGDFEAQASQGAVNLHSDEHLVSSDRGVAMLRRLMKQQISVVAEGGDPLGVSFDSAQATVTTLSGNFFK